MVYTVKHTLLKMFQIVGMSVISKSNDINLKV